MKEARRQETVKQQMEAAAARRAERGARHLKQNEDAKRRGAALFLSGKSAHPFRDCKMDYSVLRKSAGQISLALTTLQSSRRFPFENHEIS